mmetsp:Transcript_1195/g.2484  ORF Transcript_1195/g.2484 Transcript_1195/m.2484 type:complete len:136 (-) Transcript_1195:167-574(-)
MPKTMKSPPTITQADVQSQQQKQQQQQQLQAHKRLSRTSPPAALYQQQSKQLIEFTPQGGELARKTRQENQGHAKEKNALLPGMGNAASVISKTNAPFVASTLAPQQAPSQRQAPAVAPAPAVEAASKPRKRIEL